MTLVSVNDVDVEVPTVAKGPPLFVARPGASDEDDGVVLSVVLDANALERERALAARELLAKTNGAQKSRVPQWLRNVLPQSALKTSTN